MKILFNLTCFLILHSTLFGQDINQFNANGKRHGIWKKTFDKTNVLRYEGEFLNGKEIGVFKFYKNIKSKAVLTASKQFNKNNNIADVKFYNPKGNVISEGQMDGKMYIGTWKYYQKNSNQLLILEHFNNFGLLTGKRLVYYENGQIAEEQNYKEGILDGTSFWYSENNIVLKEFLYVDGELHGRSRYYNPKGEMLVEGIYKRNKKDGIWKFYDNGKLTEEKDFTYKPKYIKKNN